MKLDAQQRNAVACLAGRRNAFLTGSAGTGKTTVISHYLGQAFEHVHVTASTGVAAINLRDRFFAITGGLMIPVSTIYRWAGIALGPKEGQTNEDYFAWLIKEPTRSQFTAWKRLGNAEAVVIDEVSMLPGRIVSYLDFHCRKIRETDEPFGGLRIIAVGDFLQLPPVAKNGNYDWAFECEAWKAGDFRPLVLTNVHRQSDAGFTALLNGAREGRLDGGQMALLNARVARFPRASILRLFTHNAQVDKWNNYQLDTLDGEEAVFEAEFSGSEYESRLLANSVLSPTVLRLRRDARVMITCNLSDGAGGLLAVNGALGTVVDWSPGSVSVKLDDGKTILLEPWRWTLDPQNKESAAMEQFPLRLAWASTIHKAQGLTLDSALIDLRATREPGQAYVALSRVRSLDGLHLKDTFKGLWVSPEAIRFHRSLPPLPESGEILQLQPA